MSETIQRAAGITNEDPAFAAAQARWQERADRRPVKDAQTASGIPIKLLYTAEDIAQLDYLRDLGLPGDYPFTRGIYPTMYRGNIWTIRQYAGYGTAGDTNALFRRLLTEGNTGLSVALDLPTQCGYDSDDERASEEVGRLGVAISSLRDMEVVFKGIPIDRVSTSFTINATAGPILAMYLAVAERQGVPLAHVSGTVQNDILKEFLARGAWIYPVEPSVRLAVDVIEYCTCVAPRFNPISVSSYHISEAGASELDSVGITFSNALAYIDGTLSRGLSIDEFAPRISFNLSMNRMDFFEEIAKLRGARRLWARLVKERYLPRDERTCMLRLYAGCGGISMTRQEPLNNIVRVAYQMLAMALAGPQAMHACSYDEAFEIPSAQAQKIALRTQQILAHETGITDTVDPLGGSYFVEALTDAAEQHIRGVMAEVDAHGGPIAAVSSGYLQQRIADAAYREELRVHSGEKKIVGVNLFPSSEPPERFDRFIPDPTVRERQAVRLRELRAERDNDAVRRALDELRRAAERGENTMPVVADAVRAYATIGEICSALRDVLGEYRDVAVV